jgi:hypothetical protein
MDKKALVKGNRANNISWPVSLKRGILLSQGFISLTVLCFEF